MKLLRREGPSTCFDYVVSDITKYMLWFSLYFSVNTALYMEQDFQICWVFLHCTLSPSVNTALTMEEAGAKIEARGIFINNGMKTASADGRTFPVVNPFNKQVDRKMRNTNKEQLNTKGWGTIPKQMIFLKSSKRPLTPSPPSFSENNFADFCKAIQP